MKRMEVTLTIGSTDPLKVHDPSAPVPTKVSDLESIVGGMSKPSKMPGYCYSLPAKRCKVGSKLRSVKGSVCAGCYAMKGFYSFPKVAEALERRFQSLRDPRWTAAMIALMLKRSIRYFRWHDSGDIQSVSHLRNIVLVCLATPGTRHWLPTREYRIVEQYIEQYGALPANLVVRASAHMIGATAPSRFRHSSMVLPKGIESAEGAFTCPAPLQGNECRGCRACWSSNASTIAYRVH
jgi:hypothetical protein